MTKKTESSEAPTPPEKPQARRRAEAEPPPTAPPAGVVEASAHEEQKILATIPVEPPSKLEQLRLATDRLLAATPTNWAAWISSATAAQVNEYYAAREHARITLEHVFF